MVAGCVADYHSGMPAAANQTFRVVERCGPGGRTVLCSDDGERLDLIVLSQCSPDLPELLPGARLLPRGHAAWRLESAGQSFDLAARALDAIEVRPGLYAGLHRDFAPGAGDRLAARLLLALLGLPGGAALLRRWHAVRSA